MFFLKFLKIYLVFMLSSKFFCCSSTCDKWHYPTRKPRKWMKKSWKCLISHFEILNLITTTQEIVLSSHLEEKRIILSTHQQHDLQQFKKFASLIFCSTLWKCFSKKKKYKRVRKKCEIKWTLLCQVVVRSQTNKWNFISS